MRRAVFDPRFGDTGIGGSGGNIYTFASLKAFYLEAVIAIWKSPPIRGYASPLNRLFGQRNKVSLYFVTPRVVDNQFGLVRRIGRGWQDGGLVTVTFRSLNSFMRPFVRMPRGFSRRAMSDVGVDYRSH